MSYFSELYGKLQYTMETDGDIVGLRNAQLGAVHAIASFITLRKKCAGIVIMPTGSGKTAVLMMTPYILHAKKVLIVTPSVMVRGQIYEDFFNLKTLKKANVFEDAVIPPSIYELKKMYTDEFKPYIDDADVVVSSPQCALSLSESNKCDEFDLVLIDEAHHVPAPTWQQILINIKQARHFLFTATPFRMDRKEIKGEIIYTYPLSMAYHDGIFGEVQYIPVETGPEKDSLIAKEAERIFINDRQQGLSHYLMVRTDTKDKAKQLEILYAAETTLKLKRIDSSMPYKTVRESIELLKSKQIDGIICVDMLGEGFDFPNLKIAAIHSPHKSLASILQFIGRFARTNADDIGAAKFIAMNDGELMIENYRLFTNDSVWQEIIIDMNERRIQKEEAIKKSLEEYVHGDGSSPAEDEVSLYSLRPNCHAKVYAVSGFNIEGAFPDFCGIDRDDIYRNYSDNTIVGIGQLSSRPIWSGSAKVLDVENYLFIIHYQKETSLLFIYSRMKSETDYELIVEAFTSEYDKIPRNEMHRVLGDMQEFEMFNTGMQNRYAESGESYRIYAGSNVASAIDPTTGKMFSAGHVFCKANSNTESITIGYSSGSKLWSSKYLSIPEYVRWCDDNGRKIINKSIVVKTNTNYDFMPMPMRLIKFPTEIFFCFFSDKTYSSPPVLMTNENEASEIILTDASINIISITTDKIVLSIVLYGLTDTIQYTVDGKYSCSKPTIFLKDGRHRITLADYLNHNPLVLKTTDDTVVEGNEILSGAPNLILFSTDNVTSIDWEQRLTDIRCEFGKAAKGKKSIQDTLHEVLVEKNDFNYLIYDHGTGEMADYITIRETDYSIDVAFYHVKAMKGTNFNSDVGDIYEVTQQAIKSTIWLKSKGTLLDKVRSRRKSDRCELQKGRLIDLEKALKQSKLFSARIVIVQPAISKSTDFPDKYQEVLAATNFYIKNSGRVTQLEIWGSI